MGDRHEYKLEFQGLQLSIAEKRMIKSERIEVDLSIRSVDLFRIMLLLLLVAISAVRATNISKLDLRCETDLQCANLLVNSICSNQRCVCPKDYKSDQYSRCIQHYGKVRSRREVNYDARKLGDHCDWSHQCRRVFSDLTKVCVSHRCQCAQGYFAVDVYRCVQDFSPFDYSKAKLRIIKSSDMEPPGYGSRCMTNIECQHFTNQLECFKGTCVCPRGYVPLSKYICYHLRPSNIHSTDTDDDVVTGSSTISIGSTTLPPINNEVIKSLGKLGNSCTDDYFCRRAVPQSHCYNGECACADGFIPLDLYTCIRNVEDDTTTKSTLPPIDYKSLLGGPCSIPRNCHTSNAICLNSICTCPEGHFAIDNWSCVEESESSEEDLMDTTEMITTTTPLTTSLPTTTIFRWWPWSPTPITRQPMVDFPNAFRVRCLINRQCASMDRNSHCTLFGRCVCNQGYQLETTSKGQRCIRPTINEDDCD